MAMGSEWVMASDDDVVRLLHRVDGQLGLAVYRGEGGTAQWKAEATYLIGCLRNAVKYMQTRDGANQEGAKEGERESDHNGG